MGRIQGLALAEFIMNELLRLELVTDEILNKKEPPKRQTWAECEKEYWATLTVQMRGNICAMKSVAKVSRSTVHRKFSQFDLLNLLKQERNK